VTAIVSTTTRINDIEAVITLHSEIPPRGEATINLINGKAIHITFVNSGSFTDHQDMLNHISAAMNGRDDRIAMWIDRGQMFARFIDGENS
jgi:hypothetical protein